MTFVNIFIADMDLAIQYRGLRVLEHPVDISYKSLPGIKNPPEKPRTR